MHRLAFFVEGLTEALFVQNLVEAIAGKHNVRIDQKRIVGGSSIPKRVITISAVARATDERFYVLIYDCGGDHQVATRIREEHENLTKGGYNKIIGLRDVRPNFTAQDIPQLERALMKYIKTSLIPVQFILAIMEIEAWFLAETSHFEKLSAAFCNRRIYAEMGIDLLNEDMSLRDAPSDDLAKIYALEGLEYIKAGLQTIENLDYERIYLELPDRIPYLHRLVVSIDEFLALN